MLFGMIINWYKHYGKQNGVSLEIKTRTTIWFSNFISEYLPKEIKNTNSKRYMHPYTYCWIFYNSQDTEATQGSIPWIDKWIKKTEYHSDIKKNEMFSPVTTQMDLEGIMLTEISQTEKDRYIPYDFTYMEPKKKQSSKAKCKETHRYREQMNCCQSGRGGWMGKISKGN